MMGYSVERLRLRRVVCGSSASVTSASSAVWLIALVVITGVFSAGELILSPDVVALVTPRR